jgi:L-ascorbate metabolism protein UlaG (beta-lactamase superfamily)
MIAAGAACSISFEEPLSGITWLGHSTVVVDLDGTRLVTDPVLRSRIWHLRRDAAVAPASIGHLDAILVSHTHYDHLDLGSLDLLDSDLLVVAPRGVGGLVRRRGFTRTVELDVGDELELGALSIRATRAEHESSRGPFSPSTPSLGYIVEAAARVYFAGDTALFAGMRELGPVDLALLPVAGWGPRLGPGHLDPAGAAEALRLLRAKAAVPIHWGTLRRLFAERPDDRPAREFARLASELAPNVDVRVLSIGETLPLEAVR